MANCELKRILYVDASFNNESKLSKVSLYDKEIDKLETLVLTKPQSSGEAERYAILYVCLYSQLNGIADKKIHILNDNYGAVNHKKIIEIIKYYKMGLSWIPREINCIADSGTRSEINVPNESSIILEMFYDIVMNNELTFVIKTKDTIPKVNIPEKPPVVLSHCNILRGVVENLIPINAPYVLISQVGTYLKANYPEFKYTLLKKEFLKCGNDFKIIDDRYVKIY